MFGKRLINTGGVACTTDTLQILGDTSCVATYRLNGDATDLSGNYNGTATSVTYVTGKFGDAASFGSGASSYVDLGLGSAFGSGLFYGKNTYSVSVWFKKSTSTLGYIFADYAYDSVNIILRIQAAGQLTIFSRYNNTDSGYESTTLYNDGLWHNVIVSFNSENSSRVSYIDGVLVDTRTASGTWVGASNQKITIGAQYYTAGEFYQSSFDGDIDQVRIFNKAITAAEVTTLYNEVAC